MDQSEVIIRDAVPTDVPAVAELIEPFVAQKKLLPRSNEELADLTRHGFAALHRDQLVGFAAVEVYSRKLAEIQCLAVAAEWQRHGIGKRLIRHCIRRAHELNILELMAISASDAFLVECGFHYSLPEQKRALFFQPRVHYREEDD